MGNISSIILATANNVTTMLLSSSGRHSLVTVLVIFQTSAAV